MGQGINCDELPKEELLTQYDVALRKIYDELYELNITKDSYRIVYHAENKYVTPAEEGVLSDTIQQVMEEMIHPDDRNRFLAFLSLDALRIAFAGGQECCIDEFRKLWTDGQFHWASLTIFPVKSTQTTEELFLCFIMDICDKKRMEFDPLTGLFNEQSLYMHTERLLAQNKNQTYAMIRVDVDRFKFINEIYGLEEGNHLLQCIAQALRDNASSYDVCGRINNDIFCILKAYESLDEIVQFVQIISAVPRQCGILYRAVFSYGICIVDDITLPANILCDRANLALRTVKGNRLKTWAYYDVSLRRKQFEENCIEEEMEEALTQNQFCIYLQPKYALTNGRIVGAEALVRWKHPKEGILPPYRFIPLFERNGFIVKLDEYVWEQTFRLLRTWLDRQLEPVPVSINVSRIQIYNPDFSDKILGLLQKYKIPVGLIELELTESAFVENTDELYSNMAKLQTFGITFSMDDFGSGYSSLNMLKDAPIDTIKLDHMFLNETTSTEKGQIIIQNTILLARQLHLNVIAEGVETWKQAKFLSQAGCEAAQGFYFARPMPIEQFETLVFGHHPE